MDPLCAVHGIVGHAAMSVFGFGAIRDRKAAGVRRCEKRWQIESILRRARPDS
jgi:hypothetical protein